MDETKALSILSALANGVNPLTGEIFAADSPYQQADVVRALFAATQAMQQSKPTGPRAQQSGGATNAGKPWSEAEDRELLTSFDAGTALADIAQTHGRTKAGIQARLEKHGRLQIGVNVSGQGAANTSAHPSTQRRSARRWPESNGSKKGESARR